MGLLHLERPEPPRSMPNADQCRSILTKILELIQNAREHTPKIRELWKKLKSSMQGANKKEKIAEKKLKGSKDEENQGSMEPREKM